MRGTKYRRARRRDGPGETGVPLPRGLGAPCCAQWHPAPVYLPAAQGGPLPRWAPPKLKPAAIVAGTVLLIIGLPGRGPGPGAGRLGGTWTSWHAAGAST